MINKNFILYEFLYKFDKKFFLMKNCILFFYNFLYKYVYMLNSLYLYKWKSSLESLILINFKNKQTKVNILDFKVDKKYIFTIGFILNFLGIFKKSDRRNSTFLKYLISYIIKNEILPLDNKKTILVLKGFTKNFVKLIYFFKLIITSFNVGVLFINPIRMFNNLKIKKKRSIKRRLFKKLVDFNKI